MDQSTHPLKPLIAFMTRHEPDARQRASLTGYDLITIPQNPRPATVLQYWLDLNTHLPPGRVPYAVVFMGQYRMWYPICSRLIERSIIPLKAETDISDIWTGRWLYAQMVDGKLVWKEWTP